MIFCSTSKKGKKKCQLYNLIDCKMHFNFREVKVYSSWNAVIPYHQFLPSFLHLLDIS